MIRHSTNPKLPHSERWHSEKSHSERWRHERSQGTRSGSRRQLSRKQRRGASLVQVLVVISLTSILLGVMGVMVHSLVKAHGSLGDKQRELSAIRKLAQQFRDDIHLSKNAAAQVAVANIGDADREALEDLAADEEGDFNNLILTGRDGDVHYVSSRGIVTRVELIGQSQRKRETWTFAKDSRIDFAVTDDELRIVSINIAQQAGIGWHIDAALGLLTTEGGSDATE